MKKKLLCMILSLSCILSLTTPVLAISPTPSKGVSIDGSNGRQFGAFCHLTKVDDGYLRVEDMSDNRQGMILGECTMLIEYYNEDFELTGTSSVPFELQDYLAFYAGENHYYIIFTQTNYNEDDNVEVIRVVQYDKDWNRLKACSISGINTTSFNSTPSADMAEVDGHLLVHSSHTMYKTADGICHQANLRYTIDIETMNLLEEGSSISANPGYVSHSFNQIVEVAADGGVYTADHGDGYPRAMVLFDWPGSSVVGSCTSAQVLKLAGAIGNTTTNAQMGGFEVSSTHAITAGTSIPQDGKMQGTYNIYLTSTPRNNFNTNSSKFQWVTSYGGGDTRIECTNPYLVEVKKDDFLLIWSEYRPSDEEWIHTLGWTHVDGRGNQVGDIHRTKGNLSEVPPIVDGNGNLVWYTTCYTIPEFCILNLATNQYSTTMATTYVGPMKDFPSPWAKEGVAAAKAAGLITEHNQDCYHSTTTRFQFAELVVNMVEKVLGTSIQIDHSKQFTDTTEPAVLKAATAGIVGGMGDGTFQPNVTTNREQICTMLRSAIRYIDANGGKNATPLPGNLVGYNDAYQIAPWATDSMALLVANHIMAGTSEHSVSPKDPATVEAAILLVNQIYLAAK